MCIASFGSEPIRSPSHTWWFAQRYQPMFCARERKRISSSRHWKWINAGEFTACSSSKNAPRSPNRHKIRQYRHRLTAPPTTNNQLDDYIDESLERKNVHLTSVLIGSCAINRLLRLLLWWTSTTVFLKFAVNDGGVAFVSDQTTWIWSTTGHSWKLCRNIFSISFRRKVFTLQYQTPSAPKAFSGIYSYKCDLTGWSLSQTTSEPFRKLLIFEYPCWCLVYRFLVANR